MKTLMCIGLLFCACVAYAWAIPTTGILVSSEDAPVPVVDAEESLQPEESHWRSRHHGWGGRGWGHGGGWGGGGGYGGGWGGGGGYGGGWGGGRGYGGGWGGGWGGGYGWGR